MSENTAENQPEIPELDPEELPETTPYTMWWWDCPECGDVNDNRDIEPSGVMTCENPDCQAKVRMS